MDRALPGSKKLFLPILQAMADGKETHASDLLEPIRHALDLSDGQMTETRPGSKKPKIYERITGTIMHLCNSGLLDRTQRGITRISQRGLELLATSPQEISYTTLREFAGYNPNKPKGDRPARRRTQRATTAQSPPRSTAELEHAVKNAIDLINEALATALSSELHRATAADLDRIVCELLEKLGYGTVDSTRNVTGVREGAILTDALGLNHAYVRTVAGSKPDVSDLQVFAGAIDTTQTDVGIFVASHGFTGQAKGYAMGSPKQMVLLDSEALAGLMVAHNVGVHEHMSLVVKRIDDEYFSGNQSGAA